MAVVVFDPAVFVVRYPEFSAVPAPTLQSYFNEACLYLDNSDCSPVQNIQRRTLYLWMLTAHIATLTARGNDVVGRTSSATEGSVSAGLDNGVPGSAAWFQQTQPGSSFWQATSSLRGFRYRAQPTVWR